MNTREIVDALIEYMERDVALPTQATIPAIQAYATLVLARATMNGAQR